MRFNTVLFDLDGTVVNSSEGITKAVAYSLKKHGIKYGDRSKLKCFIGPPLKEQFMKFCSVTDDALGSDFVTAYREYYSVKGIFEASVYDGIPELIEKLRMCGMKILLATSKPEKYAKVVLDHFGLTDYFDFIGGANMDNTRTSKDEVVTYSLHSADVSDLTKAVLIGDCTHDIIGARKAGIDTISVSFGFGDRNELMACSPLCICDTTDEIYEYIVNS